eukprot:m.442290 g.442290  ORF g.442290 m.442290 type:complete len:319 (-) comp20286_c2_seq12:65-1021(-)
MASFAAAVFRGGLATAARRGVTTRQTLRTATTTPSTRLVRPARPQHRSVSKTAAVGVAAMATVAGVAAVQTGGLMSVATCAADMPANITLYQYQACPFCTKVRTFLDYCRVPYNVVEVDPLSKKEIKFSSDYKKVPIVVLGDEQLNDSTEIITRLAAHTSNVVSGTEEEATWRAWVDSHLVHLLPANIYRTPGEAIRSFDYLLENGNFTVTQRTLSRYVGAISMYLLCKLKLNKKYGITEPRQQLYDAVNEWTTHLGDRDFNGGGHPDLADLAVFGALRSVESLATFDDMVANTSVEPWFYRMKEAVGPSSRITAEAA